MGLICPIGLVGPPDCRCGNMACKQDVAEELLPHRVLGGKVLRDAGGKTLEAARYPWSEGVDLPDTSQAPEAWC